MNSTRLDLPLRLHLPCNRKRVPCRSHHCADVVLLVVPIDELERDRLALTALLSANNHAQRNEILSAALGQSRAHRRNGEIARRDHHSLDFDRLEIEQTELANRFHYLRVAGITESLVFHVRN